MQGGDSQHITLRLPVWPVQKIDRSWKMTVDYQKLNHVAIPTAMAAVLSLSKQISTSPGT